MIESCSKKRMLLTIILLGGLTILVLIVESHWTESAEREPIVENQENKTYCPQGEHFEVISECDPCSDFEIASKIIQVCNYASYKEVIKCSGGKTVTRSCDKVVWLEESKFWKFCVSMLALSLVSCTSVYWREHTLRQRMIRKVARQLRISV